LGPPPPTTNAVVPIKFRAALARARISCPNVRRRPKTDILGYVSSTMKL
jgi:hypothetical protein